MPAEVALWFPNKAFANLYGIVVLAALLSDQLIPLLVGRKGRLTTSARDRGSFLLIYLASALGLAAGLYFRYRNIGVAPLWMQALALPLLAIGTLLREWAIVLLGRFFSRTVTIEQDHRLIMGGPFRFVRHPAYTGMLLADSSIILGLGTWAGALFMFIVMLFAALYRIHVEEQALLERFGDEYRTYMRITGRLFPS